MGKLLDIYFYRHGYTKSNEQGRFGGWIDPVLSEKGYDELKELREKYEYPKVEQVFSSPAMRAQQTAALLFPSIEAETIDNLWEYCFGCEEYTKVTDMAGTRIYEKYLKKDMDCTFDEEDGETLLEATFRIQAGLTRIITKCRARNLHQIAVVSHGEILFLLMKACLLTEEPMINFMLCPNGMGVHARVDMDQWFHDQKMDFIEYIPEGAPRLAAEDSPFYINME